MPFGLTDTEHGAFGSILPWLAAKSGIDPVDDDFCKVVMACLLAVDTNAYFTNRYSMSPCIRKILKRIMETRELFMNTQYIDKDAKSTDMFTGEEENVLYIETPSGMKTDCASEDSWSYHCLINGIICPSTREPIIAFYRGRARTTRSTFDYKTLKVPSIFISNDKHDFNKLKNDLEEDVVFEDIPFDLTNTIFFEAQYGIPQERSFTYVFLRETYGLSVNQVHEIGNVAAIFI